MGLCKNCLGYTEVKREFCSEGCEQNHINNNVDDDDNYEIPEMLGLVDKK